MAHEINNPLGGMLQSLQNVIRRLSPGLPANETDARPAAPGWKPFAVIWKKGIFSVSGQHPGVG
jgi:hypothetical protein